jgi:serine/threonine protein kinase, bacterial
LPPRPSRRSGYRPSYVEAFRPEAGAVPFPGYRLIRLRGVGGFSNVWEAETSQGEHVAMKFMSGASSNASSTSKELRSLQALQSLHHPYLLKTRNVWSLPGCIVIAMDLADGSMLDLFELYYQDLHKPLEIEKLCLYLSQTAEALDFLNARKHKVDNGIVGFQHGDVKPNNILLVGDEAKLADYGLATPTTSKLTPCPRQGTAEYCAPEVFQGLLSDRSDQFSLAVTYHVLRTGMFPFPAAPSNKESLKGYVRPEPTLGPIQGLERSAVLRGLSPVPQDRYPTCFDFIADILQSLQLRLVRTDENHIRAVEREIPPAPRSTLVNSRPHLPSQQ